MKIYKFTCKQAFYLTLAAPFLSPNFSWASSPTPTPNLILKDDRVDIIEPENFEPTPKYQGPLFSTPQQQPGNASPGSQLIGGRTTSSGVDALGITDPTGGPSLFTPKFGPQTEGEIKSPENPPSQSRKNSQ